MPETPKVAILYVATGAYTVFWPDFLATAEQNLLPGCEVHYFVFTDAEALPGEQGAAPALSEKARRSLALFPACRPALEPAQDPRTLAGRIHRLPQEALAWPYATLLRFAMFRPLLPRLAQEGFAYVYFLNANYLTAQPVLPADLLPQEDRPLVLCRHPGYLTARPPFFPYERRRESTAYIPYNRGRAYVCGGTNGGTLSAYGALVEELARRVQQDLDKGLIARWHDESQLNRYALEREGETRLLSASFCRPEDFAHLAVAPVFLVRNKAGWIDVATVKGTAKKENPLAHKLRAQGEKLAPLICSWRDSLLGR